MPDINIVKHYIFQNGVVSSGSYKNGYISGNYLCYTASNSYVHNGYFTNSIDITNYKTFHAIGYNSGRGGMYISTSPISGVTTDLQSSTTQFSTTENEIIIDVSSLSGEYYVGYCTWDQKTVCVKEAWFE